MFAAIQQLISTVLTVIIFICPPLGTIGRPFEAQDPDSIRLNATVWSDTHIDYREFILQGTMTAGLSSLHLSKTPIDAFIITGDLTNYGDEKSIETCFGAIQKYCPAENVVLATGNHEMGHVEGVTQAECREYIVKHYNEYFGENIENVYFSKDINGYTFIVLGDQGEDTWDFPEIHQEQLDFLDRELARGTASGKPVFVICHWPVWGVNGQDKIWEDGYLEDENEPVMEVLNKYRNKNVFFLSGHVHTGFNSVLVGNWFGFRYAETIDGINYVNFPTYGLVNRYGIPWPCTGAQMEVYDDRVVFRPRNYLSGVWYVNYEMSFDLV